MKNILLPVFLSALALMAGCSGTDTRPEADAVVDEAAEQQMAGIPQATEPAAEEKTGEAAAEAKPSNETAQLKSVSATAVADIEYVCMHGEDKRIIRVIANTTSGLACEVTYEKISGVKTLWQANNDSGYCAPKAAEFARKQVGWGWKCVDNNGVEVAAP